MLSQNLYDWSDIAKISPEALVLWDIAGGPEWLASKEGPRIKIDEQNEQIVVFIGNVTQNPNKISAGVALDDWDYGVFNYGKDKKWHLGRANVLKSMGLNDH